MDILIIAIAAFFAAFLTLFSGFGLGTLLMPVMAIFFPIDVAVAITALVHFSNNIFKGSLFLRSFDKDVIIKFGLPAMIFAFIGAFALEALSSRDTLFSYQIFGKEMSVQSVKFTIGFVILIFVAADISPKFKNITFDPKFLPLGGALSGFFGGLSGHQGAFRSMFLIKCDMPKEKFIATGVFIAVMVDLSRLIVYGASFSQGVIGQNFTLAIIASIFAFIGSFFGAKFIKKITIEKIQIIISALLFAIGVMMIAGVV